MKAFASTLSLSLCLVLVEQPLLAEPLNVFGGAKQMQGDERTLHALNRLTFGPRPGDVEAVNKMGLKRWFERQLDPASIDDSALEARLANYPAMRLSQQELMERFPSPGMLRTIEKQSQPLPSDPVEHALYADQIAFQALAKTEKALANAKEAPGKNETMAPLETQILFANDNQKSKDATPVATDTHEEKLYADLDAIKVLNLAPEQRFQRVLAMSPAEAIAFRKSLSKGEVAELAAGLTSEQKEVLEALPGSLRVVSSEVLQTRLLRDLYSERQLEALMTDFWLNHFNVYIKKNQNEPFLLPTYERETIRAHALGKFEDLLVATAASPAMLVYLDNWQSIGPDSLAAQRSARNGKAKTSGLNENYARELMELHTLGVGGGYTQADVTQVARVFTGWGIDRPNEGAAFAFQPNRHEPGPKQVLGTTIREGGQTEGLEVLHLLATSPATARFISTKLAVRFVADEPPSALTDRMAKTFLVSGGDIKAVLRTMFDSPEFWAPAVEKNKVKTPLEFVASAVRATGADAKNPQPLVQALEKLGMPLYGMQTPNGYSWKSAEWVSTGALVSRMNFALVLAADKISGVVSGLPALLEQPAGVRPVSVSVDDRSVAAEKRLEVVLLGMPATERTRDAVLRQPGDGEAQRQAEKEFAGRNLNAVDLKQGMARPSLDKQTAAMAGLLLGSPEFQRR